MNHEAFLFSPQTLLAGHYLGICKYEESERQETIDNAVFFLKHRRRA